MDLVHPHRLVFEPNHEPLPRAEDGGIDAGQVTAIVIVEVTDYSLTQERHMANPKNQFDPDYAVPPGLGSRGTFGRTGHVAR